MYLQKNIPVFFTSPLTQFAVYNRKDYQLEMPTEPTKDSKPVVQEQVKEAQDKDSKELKPTVQQPV